MGNSGSKRRDRKRGRRNEQGEEQTERDEGIGVRRTESDLRLDESDVDARVIGDTVLNALGDDTFDEEAPEVVREEDVGTQPLRSAPNVAAQGVLSSSGEVQVVPGGWTSVAEAAAIASRLQAARAHFGGTVGSDVGVPSPPWSAVASHSTVQGQEVAGATVFRGLKAGNDIPQILEGAASTMTTRGLGDGLDESTEGCIFCNPRLLANRMLLMQQKMQGRASIGTEPPMDAQFTPGGTEEDEEDPDDEVDGTASEKAKAIWDVLQVVPGVSPSAILGRRMLRVCSLVSLENLSVGDRNQMVKMLLSPARDVDRSVREIQKKLESLKGRNADVVADVVSVSLRRHGILFSVETAVRFLRALEDAFEPYPSASDPIAELPETEEDDDDEEYGEERNDTPTGNGRNHNNLRIGVQPPPPPGPSATSRTPSQRMWRAHTESDDIRELDVRAHDLLAHVVGFRLLDWWNLQRVISRIARTQRNPTAAICVRLTWHFATEFEDFGRDAIVFEPMPRDLSPTQMRVRGVRNMCRILAGIGRRAAAITTRNDQVGHFAITDVAVGPIAASLLHRLSSNAFSRRPQRSYNPLPHGHSLVMSLLGPRSSLENRIASAIVHPPSSPFATAPRSPTSPQTLNPVEAAYVAAAAREQERLEKEQEQVRARIVQKCLEDLRKEHEASKFRIQDKQETTLPRSRYSDYRTFPWRNGSRNPPPSSDSSQSPKLPPTTTTPDHLRSSPSTIRLHTANPSSPSSTNLPTSTSAPKSVIWPVGAASPTTKSKWQKQVNPMATALKTQLESIPTDDEPSEPSYPLTIHDAIVESARLTALERARAAAAKAVHHPHSPNTGVRRDFSTSLLRNESPSSPSSSSPHYYPTPSPPWHQSTTDQMPPPPPPPPPPPRHYRPPISPVRSRSRSPTKHGQPSSEAQAFFSTFHVKSL